METYVNVRNLEIGLITRDEYEKRRDEILTTYELKHQVVKGLNLTGWNIKALRPYILAFINPTSNNRWLRKYVKACVPAEAYMKFFGRRLRRNNI